MRTILTNEEAEEILKPYYPRLIEVAENALKDYNTCLNISNELLSIRQVYVPATKSMIIWNYMINHAKSIFSNVENVKPIIYKRVFGLLIHDSLFIRFKKVDAKGNSFNATTDNSTLFNKQGLLEYFPEKPTLLKVGWVLNSTYSAIKDLSIICPRNSNEINWKIDVYEKIGKIQPLFKSIDTEISPEIERLLSISKKLKTNYGNT